MTARAVPPLSLVALLQVVLHFSACAPEPSLEVTVEIRAPDVRGLGLLVVRDGSASALIDCRLDERGKTSGRCPFEAPTTKWTPGQPLAFVLFGEAGTALDLRVDGLDGRGDVVTATRAAVAIPAAGSGERRLLLSARTELRARCGLDIPQDANTPEAQRDRSGLALIDTDGDGRSEIAVATPRRISLVRYAPGEAGHCALTETATVTNDCTPRPGSLIAGELDETHAGPELGVICFQRNTTTNRNRLAAWTLAPDGHPIFTAAINIPYVIGQTTRAVGADLDGDGVLEMAMLAVTSTVGPVISAVSWKVGETRLREVPIPGIRFTNPTTNLTIGPTVVSSPRGGHDALVAGGYRGGLYVVDADGPHAIDANTAAAPGAFSGAVYERPGSRPRALYVRDANMGTQLLETTLDPNSRAAVRTFAEGQRTAGFGSVAVAVGDIEGNGESSAILAVDGFVQIFPLTSTTAPARRFPIGEPTTGAMVVLLADIDGTAGADILVFQRNGGRVYAFQGTGQPITGFPVELGVPGTETRALIGDLDGDGTLELVGISFARLNVLSLGPRTYRADATPWPDPFHDARGTANLRDQRDPR